MYDLTIETILRNYQQLKHNASVQRIVQNYKPSISDFENWINHGLLKISVQIFCNYLTLDMREHLIKVDTYNVGVLYIPALDDFFVELLNSQNKSTVIFSLCSYAIVPLSARIRLEILKRDPWQIKYLTNQTEEEIDYVISQGRTYAFGGINNVSQEQAERIAELNSKIPGKFVYSEKILQSLAKHGSLSLIPKKHLTRELLITALSNGAKDPKIKFTDTELKTIITKNPKIALRSKKAMRIGLQTNPNVMQYLDKVDADVQMYWVKQDIENYHKIRNPCKQVCIMYNAAYLGIDATTISTFTNEYINSLFDILKLGDKI